MSEPLITDWINSIAALLGIPLVLWGIIKLFIKDKAQERKLSSLEKLAVSQDEMIKKMTEQIQELSNQTAEFQYQSELMQESNSLISKQVELQNDIFLHEKGVEEKKAELQRLKRLSDIKPHFIHNYSSRNSSGIIVSLKNKGGTAKKLELKKISGKFIHFKALNPEAEINSGSIIEIDCSYNYTEKENFTGRQKYELELLFEDIDENQYRQIITHQKVSNPELLEE